MSFFGDLKRTTKATVGAVSKGVELLTFAAEELDKSAGVLVLKSECYRLEAELRSLKIRNFSLTEIRDVRGKLIEAYRLAIPEVGDFDRQNIASKLEAMLVESGRAEIGCVVDRIKFKRYSLETAGSGSPASKIRSLNALRLDYSLLISLADKLADKDVVSDARKKISEIDADVIEFEKLRFEITTDSYREGKKKSLVRKCDGAPHGLSEFWYESGQIWKRMNYQNGHPEGRCILFRKDGSVLIEIDINQSESKMAQKIYLSGGEKILDGILSHGSGELNVWLWDGVYVGRAVYKDGRISRALFFVGVVLRPKVWVSLYSAYRRKEVRILFDEMLEAANEYALFANDFAK
ncbi:MAG: toxin-antitoxin system YwqK family antitoxin [Pseudomonadota bacterium]